MAMTREERRAYDRQKSAEYRANHPDLNARQRALYAQNRKDRLATRQLYLHRLRPEDWAEMWEAQEGKCYLCGEAMDINQKVAIEHDHTCCPTNTSCSICRRGLAHNNCNVAVGYAGDDPDRLRRMADALEVAKLGVAKRLAAAGDQLAFDTDLIA